VVKDAQLLASYGQLRTASFTRPIVACPNNRGMVWFDGEARTITSARCRQLNCPVCLPAAAFKYARAIALAQPAQAIRLSLVGDDWDTIRKRVATWRKALRRMGLRIEYAYHVEVNPRGTGYHIHMWVYGDRLTESVVSEAATRAGMGWSVRVEGVEQPRGTPLYYGLKAVLYVPESAETFPPAAEVYRLINGGRSVVHTSRGFWRDGPGRPLSGADEALGAAWAKRGAPHSGKLMSETYARHILASAGRGRLQQSSTP
jgi:hypothetical protein